VQAGGRCARRAQARLLGGCLDQAMRLRLKSVAADLRDGSGDEKLDQVLGEIDLRVAPELAKAGVV
jgi:Class II flagellar assembly regulator